VAWTSTAPDPRRVHSVTVAGPAAEHVGGDLVGDLVGEVGPSLVASAQHRRECRGVDGEDLVVLEDDRNAVRRAERGLTQDREGLVSPAGSGRRRTPQVHRDGSPDQLCPA